MALETSTLTARDIVLRSMEVIRDRDTLSVAIRLQAATCAHAEGTQMLALSACTMTIPN
jgi:hypothetical protein